MLFCTYYLFFCLLFDIFEEQVAYIPVLTFISIMQHTKKEA
uniref:Ubiquitin-conjugating enzyme E2 34-like isoform X3 n=1 Tax=Rhizophora mucronata TaxID=61149 RepID=A0A2P2L928_RHIMU